MSRKAALEKLAMAAQLSARASKLYAEAADELAKPEEQEPAAATSVDRSHVIAGLRKAGARL